MLLVLCCARCAVPHQAQTGWLSDVIQGIAALPVVAAQRTALAGGDHPISCNKAWPQAGGAKLDSDPESNHTVGR
jgi:hypothetical protein